ncbi:MAG: helix-turn-helix domain-containing protein, partial [Candidatus Cybelea sp.]
MQSDRFFQTTRGKIVSELRRRGSASAADLAQVFGLSPNAVRQQLMVLERDSLVAETSVRRGPTKPTYEFSLTAEADRLFPQSYDKMLTAVLREVKDQFGAPAIAQIFDGLSRRAVARAQLSVTSDEPEQRVAQLTEMLRKSGVIAEYSLIDDGFVLHEHNCPYST